MNSGCTTSVACSIMRVTITSGMVTAMKYASVCQLIPNRATTITSNSTPAKIPKEPDATVENAWRPILDSPLKLINISLSEAADRTSGLQTTRDVQVENFS